MQAVLQRLGDVEALPPVVDAYLDELVHSTLHDHCGDGPFASDADYLRLVECDFILVQQTLILRRNFQNCLCTLESASGWERVAAQTRDLIAALLHIREVLKVVCHTRLALSARPRLRRRGRGRGQKGRVRKRVWGKRGEEGREGERERGEGQGERERGRERERERKVEEEGEGGRTSSHKQLHERAQFSFCAAFCTAGESRRPCPLASAALVRLALSVPRACGREAGAQSAGHGPHVHCPGPVPLRSAGV